MNFNTILAIRIENIAGTVNAVRTGHRRSRGSMPAMGKNLFALRSVHNGCGTHPVIVFNRLHQGSSPGIKRRGT